MTIRTEIELRTGGRVARVTIDHPARLNCLSSERLTGLAEQIEALAGDTALRALVLQGAGPKAFCGGADITEMAGLSADTARAFITRVHRVCTALRALPVPTIARLQGYCFGGGLEIAAACDLRLAADDARLGMPEVKLGLPSVVEAALLPMLIGWGRTRRLLLLGETIDAATAERWGLVERVVPVAMLDSAIAEWLDLIIANGPRALRLQKALTNGWESQTPEDAIQSGIDCFVEAWRHEEPRDLMRNFLAARRKG